MSYRRLKKVPYTIDVALLTPVNGQLAVFLRRGSDARDKWVLPWEPGVPNESLDSVAARLATAELGLAPSWLEQVGAFGGDRRHPAESDLSVAYSGLAPLGTPPPTGGNHAWFAVSDVPALAPRQRAILDETFATVRSRMDESPVAFRLLPSAFTLTELQHMYELLLGKRLHKASFRRALQAAWLVEPTDEWRSEGRGRPAQLYRYSPRRKRPAQRGIRLDLLTVEKG